MFSQCIVSNKQTNKSELRLIDPGACLERCDTTAMGIDIDIVRIRVPLLDYRPFKGIPINVTTDCVAILEIAAAFEKTASDNAADNWIVVPNY